MEYKYKSKPSLEFREKNCIFNSENIPRDQEKLDPKPDTPIYSCEIQMRHRRSILPRKPHIFRL